MIQPPFHSSIPTREEDAVMPTHIRMAQDKRVSDPHIVDLQAAIDRGRSELIPVSRNPDAAYALTV